MAKRRTKKANKVQHSIHERDSNNTQKELQLEEQLCALSDHEGKRRITAIQAIRDAEIEHLLTRLRLLRSYFSKDQLATPALQFFMENLPNLSVIKNEKDGQFELEWKSKDILPSSYDNAGDGCPSFMQRTSITYPDCGAAFPATSGFQFSGEAVCEGHSVWIGWDTKECNPRCPSGGPYFYMTWPKLTNNPHIRLMADQTTKRWTTKMMQDLEELSKTQMPGFQDAFTTPGVNGQRLSVGMTPKTVRLPKNGEMLLSVHGSPLGVYREEENMEAIHESEEGTGS